MLNNTNSGAFAQSELVQGSSLRFAKYLFLTLAGIALITASAKIQVPFWPVPMTLQTLAIMTIFAGFGMRLGVATILGYLGAGLSGLPVFAGPLAGPAYFAGPTAGFLAGFVIAAVIVGYAADKGLGKSPLKMFGAMVVADIAIFALGFAWLGFMFVEPKAGTTLGAATAFKYGVQPYIIADLVKMALASGIVAALWGMSKRLRS